MPPPTVKTRSQSQLSKPAFPTLNLSKRNNKSTSDANTSYISLKYDSDDNNRENPENIRLTLRNKLAEATARNEMICEENNKLKIEISNLSKELQNKDTMVNNLKAIIEKLACKEKIILSNNETQTENAVLINMETQTNNKEVLKYTQTDHSTQVEVKQATKVQKLIYTTCDNKEQQQNKIILISDDYGRNMNKILYNKIKKKTYKIEHIFKPGASFKQVIESMDSLTKNYTMNDHVVVIAGSNNFNKTNKYPLFRDIADKVKGCSNTNIIIASTPYKSRNENKYIHKFNKKLNEFIFSLDNVMPGKINCLNVTDKKYKNLSKNQVVNSLVNIIFNVNNKDNLVKIKITKNIQNQNVLDHSEKCNLDRSINVIQERTSLESVQETSRIRQCTEPKGTQNRTKVKILQDIRLDQLNVTSHNAKTTDIVMNRQNQEKTTTDQETFLYPRLSQMSITSP